jgi:hypothetical protein
MSRTGSKRTVDNREAEAEARRLAAARSLRNRRLAIGVGIALVMVGAIVFLATRPPPAALAQVEVFPDQGQAHLSASDPAPQYNSNPPTSGPHAPAAAVCGIYREAPPDINLVHDLEHGVIVVYYDPVAAADVRDEIESFARDAGSHVIVAPREGMPTPIALTAWTRLLLLSEFDRSAFDAFYGEFSQRGPEAGVSCPFTVDQSVG